MPFTKDPLHSSSALPAAIVDGGDDLERLQPLDKALHLHKAAVLTVRDP